MKACRLLLLLGQARLQEGLGNRQQALQLVGGSTCAYQEPLIGGCTDHLASLICPASL
jgi:hypothetical protein